MEESKLTTLDTSDFTINSCLATIYTPEGGISPSRFIQDLYPKWSTRFNADPAILPMEIDVPREVPRIILSNSDSTWRCEISLARVNILCRHLAGPSQDARPEFYKSIVQLLKEYLDFSKTRVGRLAGVLTRFAYHDTPGLFLARHFCKERWHEAPLNRPEGFELHAHKKYKLSNEFEVNSWVRNKTGTLEVGDQKKAIVLVEQDINTLAEEATTRSFTTEEVLKFFNLVSGEYDKILQLYYPTEGNNA
jgi:hypothetical protein